MASPKTAPAKTAAKTPRFVDGSQKEAITNAIRARITERAYGIFETSGKPFGSELAHWLQAESEVLQHGLDVRESGSWIAINASLPDVQADDVEIFLEPERVIVRAQKAEALRNTDSGQLGLTQQELFLTADLKNEVDPETASASLKDQKLTLMVKKRMKGEGNTRQV